MSGTTNNVELYGIINWAKVFEQTRDRKGYQRTPSSKGAFEDSDGACTVDMILDEENLQKLREAGTSKDLDNKKNMTDDGYKVKLVRKFKNHAAPSLGGAPKVAHADGSPWDLDMDGLIGNGSVGIAYVHVYIPDDGAESTTRLDGLQVIEHVPYESDNDGFKGPTFKDYSAPSPSTKSSPKKAPTPQASDLDDDEIPF